MASSQARNIQDAGLVRIQAEGTVAPYDVRQMPDGSAGVYDGTATITAGSYLYYSTTGTFNVVKNTSVALLKGGKVYWDHSAGEATFRKLDDQDFYIGRVHEDAAAADSIVVVELNVDPPYDLDLARDPFVTAIVGTQALGGLALNRRGGAHDVVISSTNEAQKVDALGIDGFAAAGANAIVEFAFCVPSDGAGTAVDVSVGIASATHATDADSIAQHLLMHLDANNTAIRFQSKDGTTTVTSTDSTKTYTEGQTSAVRKEVWFDLRDPSDVQVYVDGVNVLAATVFDVSAAASTWRLLMHVEKTASTDTYEFQLDWLRARFADQ